MPGILNATTNAVAGLATFASLGQNATLAAPSVGVLGVGIPGIPLISFRDYFLTSLSSWVASIPNRTQYIAIIEQFPPGLTSKLMQKLEGNRDGGKKNFDIDKAKNVLTSYPFQKVVGCIFLDGVDIPSENLTASNAPIENNRGFLQGGVLGGREAFSSNNLTLQFRETNTSFTDFVMRPWLIAAAHAGYIARPVTDPLYTKCNIMILQYTKTYQNLSMIPRKIWSFYDCVPLSLSNRNMTYDSESMETYDVAFLYDEYGLQNTLYIPLPDILTTISKGSIPRISPLQR